MLLLRKGKRFSIIYGKAKKPVAMLVPFENEDDMSSYEIGKKYFGKYGSGDGQLSKNYKVVAAEQTGIRKIISVDSDFNIYRLPSKEMIENVFIFGS